jgi:transposase InsO family protein
VFFVIELSTRRIRIVGIAPQPNACANGSKSRRCGRWCLLGTRLLLHGRDPLYRNQFARILQTTGLKSLNLAARSPNLNAYAERFVRTVKESCLDPMIFFGEASLRHAIRGFVTHYHFERNHQGLGNPLIDPLSQIGTSDSVRCRERLGGMLNFYTRAA